MTTHDWTTSPAILTDGAWVRRGHVLRWVAKSDLPVSYPYRLSADLHSVPSNNRSAPRRCWNTVDPRGLIDCEEST